MDHHRCTCQGRINIWLILHTQLLSQGNTCKEHPQMVISQFTVQFLRQNTILRPLTSQVIQFFITDKHIIGLLVRRNFNDFFLNLIDFLCLIPIHAQARGICICKGFLIVNVCCDRRRLYPVAGRHTMAIFGVIYILHAIFAKNKAPIRFWLTSIFFQDILE